MIFWKLSRVVARGLLGGLIMFPSRNRLEKKCSEFGRDRRRVIFQIPEGLVDCISSSTVQGETEIWKSVLEFLGLFGTRC